MRFTVVWNPAAKRALADLWTDAPDRAAVATAADDLDRRLRSHADSTGESRSGSVRFVVIEPIAAYFDVSEPDRIVTVFAVWRPSR